MSTEVVETKVTPPTVAKCCDTCGFLACNKGKKSTGGTQDWYSQENLDRLWLEINSTGQMLVCHSTDPKSVEYGASEKATKIKPGNYRACLGAVMLVYMHVKIYEWSACKYAAYKRRVKAKNAMSIDAMREITFMIALGRSELFGGMEIPRSFDESRELQWPTGQETVAALFLELQKQHG